MDKNHDQKLSTAEILDAIPCLLKLDKDKSNSLSAEELRPKLPKRKGPSGGRGSKSGKKSDKVSESPPPPPSVLMTALDANGDGELSKEELAAAIQSLAALDQDNNKELSAEESGLTKQETPQPGGGQGGQGGPPGGPPGGGRPGPPPQ